MNFGWTDEQLELRAEAATFARKVLDEDVEADDRAGRFPAEKWDKLGSWGFFGLSVPSGLGGSGLDVMTALCLTEGLGVGCSDTGLLFSATVQAWVIIPTILRFASEDPRRHSPQRRRVCRHGRRPGRRLDLAEPGPAPGPVERHAL